MSPEDVLELEEKIDDDSYSLLDKVLYGGLGYGYFCLPANIFRIIGTVIFPPIGVIMKYLTQEFPYVNLKKLLFGIDEIIYSIILTMFFYVPGLIYTLNVINCETENTTKVPESNNNN